jgi:multiple sugar transport system permease protein/N-acetylglucosamine transport system permease protein
MTNAITLDITIKKKKNKVFSKKNIFIICMLAYPVLQFATIWLFVNINSVLLTFKKWVIIPNETYPVKGWNWVGLQNYKILITNIINNEGTQSLLKNSASYMFVNLLIILPLSVLASYFLFKKVIFAKYYRVIFFLPSIMPLILLALAYQMSLDPLYGTVNSILKSIGVANPPVWFGGEPMSQRSIWIFCIWAGLSYNVILLGSAISRIPKDIVDYGKLEGISYTKELFKVVVPLIWPTFTTLVVMAMMAPFVVFLQPLFLTGGGSNTMTIALEIFFATQGNTSLETSATLGLFISAIGAPIIIIVRKFLEKCYADVNF